MHAPPCQELIRGFEGIWSQEIGQQCIWSITAVGLATRRYEPIILIQLQHLFNTPAYKYCQHQCSKTGQRSAYGQRASAAFAISSHRLYSPHSN